MEKDIKILLVLELHTPPITPKNRNGRKAKDRITCTIDSVLLYLAFINRIELLIIIIASNGKNAIWIKNTDSINKIVKTILALTNLFIKNPGSCFIAPNKFIFFST